MSSGARAFLGFVYGGVVLAPAAWMFARAFDGEGAGGTALQEALSRVADQDLLANSIWLALLTTLFALLLGAPLAFLLNLRSFPGRALLGRLHWLPLLIPPHIHAIAWARVTGDRGWLTTWLRDVFGVTLNIRAPIGDPASDAILGHLYPGPAWVMACAFFPLVTLPVSSGLRALDAEGLEAARLLGRGTAAFRRIILPQVAPRLAAGALFVFVLALTTYPVVSLLDTPTLIQRVFFTFAQVDQGAGALLALPLVAVALVSAALLAVAARPAEVRTAGVRAPAARPGGLLATLGAVALLVLAAGVPLGSLLHEAGPLRLFGDGPVDNYQSVFGRVGEAFGHSLLVTVVAVAAVLVVAGPLGRILARRGGAVEAAGLALLAIPPVVVGVALVLFYGDAARGELPAWFVAAWTLLWAVPSAVRSGLRAGAAAGAGVLAFLLLAGAAGLAVPVYERGIALVVLAQVALVLPLAVRMLRAAFRALDPAEEEAARICGHGVFSRALRIEAPRLGGAIAGAAVLAYVLCFTELAASLMTLRPGWQSVQVRIFNMVHYQSIGEVSALCVLVIALAALPVAVVGLCLGRRWEVV